VPDTLLAGRAAALTPAARAYLYAAFSRMPQADFVRVFLATIRSLHYEPDYRITQPLLLTHGDSDGTGNIKKVAPVWARRDPRCRYVVIPHAGHCANMDNPAFFNPLLREFLDRYAG
jgi:pimeloyl-ACP methyl ester carboxylesterase